MQRDGQGGKSCSKDKLIDEQVDYYDEEDKPCEMSVIMMRMIMIMMRKTRKTKRCGSCWKPLAGGGN